MEEQQTGLSVSRQVKGMISDEKVKKKFAEVLGQKAPQFLASCNHFPMDRVASQERRWSTSSKRLSIRVLHSLMPVVSFRL